LRQFLGMLIGIVGIKFFWNAFPSAEGVSSLKPLVAVALVFLLPLIDTTTVTINRLRRKQSPFVGGRDHTTHCLVYAGLSDSRVAFVFLGISLISFFLNLSLFFLVDDLTWGIFALYLTYCLAIFSVLFALSLKYWHKYAHQK
jgi:UDP-GlcNAc:undecaprenyl-phosphate GlcNAc-1-phosphate transferase